MALGNRRKMAELERRIAELEADNGLLRIRCDKLEASRKLADGIIAMQHDRIDGYEEQISSLKNREASLRSELEERDRLGVPMKLGDADLDGLVREAELAAWEGGGNHRFTDFVDPATGGAVLSIRARVVEKSWESFASAPSIRGRDGELLYEEDSASAGPYKMERVARGSMEEVRGYVAENADMIVLKRSVRARR